MSRNQWIQIASLSATERTETRSEQEKLSRLQNAITTFNQTNSLSGLQSITRALRNVELERDQRQRSAAMQQGGVNIDGSVRATRQRRRRNQNQ